MTEIDDIIKSICGQPEPEPTLEDLVTKLDKFIEKGGVGSGNWGHAGRIGERGGSARQGVGVRNYKKETPEVRKKKLLKDSFKEAERRNPDAMKEVRYWDEVVRSGHNSKKDNFSEGQYKTERRALHDKIVQKYTNVVKTGERPKLILFGGASGSGKGGLLKMLGKDAENFNYVNNDDIKAELPEYNGRNSAYLHEEASDIVNEITDKLKRDRANVIIDGTLKRKDKGLKLINDYKKLGYDVELMSTNIPLEQTLERNISRFLDEGAEGRYVPLELVVDTAEQSNINQFELIEHVDKGAIYDTNVPRGQPYKLIESRGLEND